MLFVLAEIRPSPIQGVGVFAMERIARGRLVSRWTEGIDRSFSLVELDSAPPQLREFVASHGWQHAPGIWRVSIDHGSYVNHSNTPNLTVPPDDWGSYAARNIEVGEELTEDYSYCLSYDGEYDSPQSAD